MTPLPKHLEKMRDELAEENANGESPRRGGYKDGFNQAASIMLKDMESIAKALEKIEKLTIWNNQSLEQDFHDANSIATEELKHWREKYLEVKDDR